MVSFERKRRIAVLLILFAILFLSRNKLNSLKPISSLNSKLHQYTPWKILLFGYTIHYVLSHLLSITGFGESDLPSQHYHPDFVKIRKVFTGLDAGIVSSLHIKPKWLRDIFTVILGAYFIIFGKKAENVMHRFHQQCTIEGVRACWTKGTHPLLWTITKLKERYSFPTAVHRRKIIIYPLQILKMPSNNSEKLAPIECYLYFQGTLSELQQSHHVIINYPGGGFVTMTHLHHETYVQKWCNYLRIPIIQCNYRKAPEWPYPNGFNDAYYAYKCIVATNGKCIGINSENRPLKIALSGDSAGGNFVAAVCCRCIVEGTQIPNGLLMAYPVLDLNMNLFRPVNDVIDFGRNGTNAFGLYSSVPEIDNGDVLRGMDDTPLKSYMESAEINAILNSANQELTDKKGNFEAFHHESYVQNRGESLHPLTSRIVYCNDAVLPLKYLLMLGEAYMPKNADPINDMYLSPLRASLNILKRFPMTRIHCGSVDPLIDDSRRFTKLLKFANSDIDVKLLEWDGLSHAYIQCPTFLLPQSRYSCELATHWLSMMLNVDVVNRESFKYDFHKREKGLRDATDDFAFLRSRM